MSRHEGVSCDACMKSNFRGRRFKCLLCYDYDLCSSCFESGATTSRHASDHPMQCILTRSDYELYYHGESVALEQPQAFTCPHCGKMGYQELALQEHTTLEHAEVAIEVICPVCASMPGGEPNHMTDDLGRHLALEHCVPNSVIEEAHGIGLRHMRRLPPPSRGLSNARARRSNQQLHQSGSTLIGLVSNSREVPPGMDPISELLSQLSSVRNRTPTAQSVSSQLQQLEMQLQSTRHQLERLPRQRTVSSRGSHTPSQGSSQPSTMSYASAVMQGTGVKKPTTPGERNYLLPRLVESQQKKRGQKQDSPDRSLFVQDILLSSLVTELSIEDAQYEGTEPQLSIAGAAHNEHGTGDRQEQSSNNCSANELPTPLTYPNPSLVPPPSEGITRDTWRNADVQKVRAHNHDAVEKETIVRH